MNLKFVDFELEVLLSRKKQYSYFVEKSIVACGQVCAILPEGARVFPQKLKDDVGCAVTMAILTLGKDFFKDTQDKAENVNRFLKGNYKIANIYVKRAEKVESKVYQTSAENLTTITKKEIQRETLYENCFTESRTEKEPEKIK